MASLSSPTPDEARCLWPLCSHTCCWEAEQRLRAGKPRKVKALTPSGASATASEEDRFPAITMVNASEWPDAEVFPLQSEDDFSEAATKNTLISRVALPMGARRQENVQIPNSSSAMPTHLETNRENKPVKLRTVHISPLPSYSSTSQSSKPMVTWVPSSCHVPPPDSQHSAESPRRAVKELIFLPSAEMKKPFEKKKKVKRDKSRKRAPLQRTPLKSRLNQEGKGSLKSEADTDPSDRGSSWPGSGSDLREKKASAPPPAHRLLPVGPTLAAAPEAEDDQQPPRSAQTLHLRNKPVPFEPVWEMKQRRRHTRDERHTSKYKLDLKTGIDRIDWESLTRQTYLWRRPTQPVQSERGRPSTSEDKADFVPYSLLPISMTSSHCQSKSSSTTGNCRSGAAKCRNMDYMNGVWQNYCRFLASTSRDGSPTNDDFRFWFSICFRQNPGHHAINADAKSDVELHCKGTVLPPNSQQSSQLSSTVKLTRNI